MEIPYELVEVPPTEPPGPKKPPKPPRPHDIPPIEDEPDPVREPGQDIPPLDQPEPNPDEENPPMRTDNDAMPEHLFSV